MTARILRSASIALFTIATAPLVARAQQPLTITLNVPVQVQDISASVVRVRVHCTVQLVGGATTVSFDHHDFGEAGPLVNGAFSGTATVVLSGTAQQTIAPGQQWSYQCHSDFRGAHVGPTGDYVVIDPGSAGAPLASTSGPNLVQGTFTTQ